MRRLLTLLWLCTVCCACTPGAPPLQLAIDCRASQTRSELLAEHWLGQDGIWRLRQGALLELGSRKIALEGFVRLDLPRQQARLVALNEMGLVFFDLDVTREGQQLLRSLPQLQQYPGFERGVALSLRRIFLEPRPQAADRLENQGNSQRLQRTGSDGGQLSFLFDCNGDLRQTRQLSEQDDWQIIYDQYLAVGQARVPQQIVLLDRRYGIKLSLWLQEAKEER